MKKDESEISEIKVKQMIALGNNGFVALSEEGELFNGCFTGGDAWTLPKFIWRKIPSIDPNCKEYKRFEEFTALELAAMKKKAEKLSK